MLSQQQRLEGLSPTSARLAVSITKSLEQNRTDEAERALIAGLALAPTHPEFLRLHGMIQLVRGRTDEAIDALIRSVKLRPQDASTLHALSGAYEVQKDVGNALSAARRVCELAPNHSSAWFNFGRLLFVNSHVDLAVKALRRAVELSPDHLNSRAMLAHVLNADGRAREAAEEYRKLLKANIRLGAAWWGLATLKPISLGPGEIAQMQAILGESGVDANERSLIGFALAHALENEGDYPAAFAALREANALGRKSHPYDGADFERRVEAVRSAFSEAPGQADNDQGREVIFIVSLPRSGSTLTEQILASHSQIEGTSELPDLLQVVLDECNRVRRPFPEWVHTHTPDEWRALGQVYLARTARWRKNRPRFTDKMPGNWLYIGAILSMLPQARVVVARRDPMETCFACYRHTFTQQNFTHDFEDLAQVWRGFDSICSFWAERYPNRVREQIYEKLQADPEGQIRELLAFCDLPFEEGCLNFHETERRVTTPSASQVRQPLRRDTARTDKYGTLLDPLRQALGLSPLG